MPNQDKNPALAGKGSEPIEDKTLKLFQVRCKKCGFCSKFYDSLRKAEAAGQIVWRFCERKKDCGLLP